MIILLTHDPFKIGTKNIFQTEMWICNIEHTVCQVYKIQKAKIMVNGPWNKKDGICRNIVNPTLGNVTNW